MALPSSKTTFPTRHTDDPITASDANTMQTTVRAIEDNIGLNAQGSALDVATRLASMESRGGVDQGIPNAVLAPSLLMTTTSITATSGQFQGATWVAPRNMTIIKVSFTVSAANTADDPFEWGIWNSAMTAKLLTTGSLTGASSNVAGGGLNSTGRKTITLASSVSVTAGTMYQLGLLRTGAGTGAAMQCTSVGNSAVATGPGTTIPLMFTIASQTIPLASNLSAATIVAAAQAPLQWLLEA